MQSFWLTVVLLASAPFLAHIYWQRRKNLRELSLIARRKGLNFSPFDLIGLHDRYYNLEMIRQGHNRHAWSVLYGSTEAGLLAVFRYRYDIGFGIDQDSRQWWIAVVEMPDLLPACRAWAATEEAAPEDGEQPRPNPLAVRADRSETLERLERPEVRAALGRFPAGWQLEMRGKLLAIAAPVTEKGATPEQLIDEAATLAETVGLHG